MSAWRGVAAILVVGTAVIAAAFSAGIDNATPVSAPVPTSAGVPRSPHGVPRGPLVAVEGATERCRLGEGPTETVPVPPETTHRVGQAWASIEDWAQRNGVAFDARPPASAGEIASAQHAAGVAFPADLVASLRWHDGAGIVFPPTYRLMTTTDIAALIAERCHSTGGAWGARAVPVARDDTGGVLHLVDGDLSALGSDVTGTFADYLEATAAALEGGGPLPDRPVISGDALRWHRVR